MSVILISFSGSIDGSLKKMRPMEVSYDLQFGVVKELPITSVEIGRKQRLAAPHSAVDGCIPCIR